MGFPAWLLLMLPLAQQPARVESFSPQGTVKEVRQVHARFSEPMVPFGDPRAAVMPFEIKCPEKGSARWVDERNWVYDFDRDLPAGIRCEFRLRADLRTLAGGAVAGPPAFSFSTGGPSIRDCYPDDGSLIAEDQIFILELDCPANESSVLANASFTVAGIASRVAVRIVSGPEREQILGVPRYYARAEVPRENLLLLQARQSFAPRSMVSLVWGRGIESRTGIATEEDQVLSFETRPEFAAEFSCQRENPESDCIPITPMRLRFDAPVRRADAARALLRAADGRTWSPRLPADEDTEQYVYAVDFPGPFPELATFTLEIPADIRDDAGRPLANAASFPLTVKTGEYPPLAKFAADFGILELNADPLLPVTLRNVEPAVAARMLAVPGGEGFVEPREPGPDEEVGSRIAGKSLRVPADQPNQMLQWIRRVQRRTYEDRGKSIFGPVTAGKTTSFSIPKLEGPKAFEVVGIPLREPGFYVVELESEILGARLLGEARPMYVPTTVLVTNLSVHFKWGIESSLVWVTTLDRAEPAGGASVEVRDCMGNVHFEGTTDRDGIARIGRLPSMNELPRCSWNPLEQGLVVTARAGKDMAFVHSSWNDGIESWRFQVPMEWNDSLVRVHTILDRTLFRAGETVHMKHVLRRHLTGGFGLAESPKGQVVWIEHAGSNQQYEVPLAWDARGTAETTWKIPREARLGRYSVHIEGLPVSGEFRVEEFRVPLMKGLIRGPAADPVAPAAVPLDLTVSYLAGGPAAGLPVRLRHQLRPARVRRFEGYEDFTFANGRVREALVREEESEEERGESAEIRSMDLVLDKSGSARATVTGLPAVDKPMELFAELEFKDPNGEIQTVASAFPIWHADRLVAIKPGSWQGSSASVRVTAAVTDLAGKPVRDAEVTVELFQRKTYSHRKRLVGGFYAYEHATETRRLDTFCSGRTDAQGLLVCERAAPASGNLILQATAPDSRGRESAAFCDIWVAGEQPWWFRAEDSDRMDIIPDAKSYEPGGRARLQVRMPFREATALITVEREGVGEVFVRRLSGDEPVIEIPVLGHYAPNAFISVLAVRGRVSGVQPTATVDLGRPAYKLGIAEIKVGWKAHELRVQVTADRPVYKVRETARVRIAVRTADGKAPPAGSEVAVAAVDEGLLELAANDSWDLLGAMMGRRGLGVQTATAQMHVVGKRHFGLKALPQGGGGGRQSTRELFDTLLLWKGRVALDRDGQAVVEVPLNDSLTAFRITAVALGGAGLFGTGSTSIRSTQDLMLFSGLPPVVRQGDEIRASFTVRNATERRMDVRVSAAIREIPGFAQVQAIGLAPGESREIGWDLPVPAGVRALTYEVEAASGRAASDRMRVSQKVVPAVPVRTFQATISRLENTLRIPVERPANALPDRGGVEVALEPSLLAGLEGVRDYMRNYPYTCLEQLVSRAVALRDAALWKEVMGILPSYMDADGLAMYFPNSSHGSDALTAYLLAIAHEAGWDLPEECKERMLDALQAFVEGRIAHRSLLPAVDLALRKLSALEAISRYREVDPGLLSSFTISPNLWPTSGVIDWWNLLGRCARIPDRQSRLKEAEQILRSRLSFQGTTMEFSTERSDDLWWLMASPDTNALRLLLGVLESPAWQPDIPRLVRGVLGRQRHGHWGTTVAGAWGVLAMEKFAALFEKAPVTGRSTAALAGVSKQVDWAVSPKGDRLLFAWPAAPSPLELRMEGSGGPWAAIRSLAAIPLEKPVFAGFRITKTVVPVEQREPGSWSAGDIARVRLELESTADVTWVVVDDPIPAGATILGTGLGRDSRLAAAGEETERDWLRPAFEERSFEAFRAYYEFVPKGSWTVEYTYRFNTSGRFQLPPTRVEALYSPEMFAEIPNAAVTVR
jgi:uncharacterized protein YfaS (alpha-2-macroglobulin family)